MSHIIYGNEPIMAVIAQCLEETLMLQQGQYPIHYSANAEEVPNTGKQVHAMWLCAKNFGSPFLVYSGANDATKLYLSPQVNLLYRAVHDHDHAIAYELGRGTTKYEDERYLNCLMAKRCYEFALANNDIVLAMQVFFIMYHDTVGQVEYFKEKGTFCEDQRAETTRRLDECAGYRALKQGRTSVARAYMLGYMGQCGL